MSIQRYLEITISYLEVGREVMLERSQTLLPNVKSNINRYVIIKSHLRLQLFKCIYLGKAWTFNTRIWECRSFANLRFNYLGILGIWPENPTPHLTQQLQIVVLPPVALVLSPPIIPCSPNLPSPFKWTTTHLKNESLNFVNTLFCFLLPVTLLHTRSPLG